MILYFSGTGNSKHIATILSKNLNDELISLNERIKNNNYEDIKSNKNIILVCPTYAWRTPRFIDEYLRKVKIVGASNMYFIMTCGGEIGNAKKYNKSLAIHLGLTYAGSVGVIMPDNYIIMFRRISDLEASNLIFKAEKKLEVIIKYIKENKTFPEGKKMLYESFLSGAINSGFYKSMNKTKFHVTNDCIKCGQCIKLCPLNNIEMKENGPVFNNKCTQCMACLSYCPKNAIQYKNKTKNKKPYTIEQYL